MRKESRFLEGLPVAAEWYMGSMKSGPILYPCTLYLFESTDIIPVVMEVFPTPLPVPEITNPFIPSAAPSGSVRSRV